MPRAKKHKRSDTSYILVFSMVTSLHSAILEVLQHQTFTIFVIEDCLNLETPHIAWKVYATTFLRIYQMKHSFKSLVTIMGCYQHFTRNLDCLNKGIQSMETFVSHSLRKLYGHTEQLFLPECVNRSNCMVIQSMSFFYRSPISPILLQTIQLEIFKS